MQNFVWTGSHSWCSQVLPNQANTGGEVPHQMSQVTADFVVPHQQKANTVCGSVADSSTGESSPVTSEDGRTQEEVKEPHGNVFILNIYAWIFCEIYITFALHTMQ